MWLLVNWAAFDGLYILCHSINTKAGILYIQLKPFYIQFIDWQRTHFSVFIVFLSASLCCKNRHAGNGRIIPEWSVLKSFCNWQFNPSVAKYDDPKLTSNIFYGEYINLLLLQWCFPAETSKKALDLPCAYMAFRAAKKIPMSVYKTIIRINYFQVSLKIKVKW